MLKNKLKCHYWHYCSAIIGTIKGFFKALIVLLLALSKAFLTILGRLR